MLSFLEKQIWESATFTSWGSLIVKFGGALIILPLVLRYFTAEEVIVWQLFVSINALVLLLDFGISPTFARMYAFALGGRSLSEMNPEEGKNNKKNESVDVVKNIKIILATQRWLLLRVSAIAMVAMFIFGTAALIKPIKYLSNANEGWIAWSIVCVSSWASIGAAAYASCLQGINEIPRLRRWEIASGTLQMISSALVVLSGGGLLEVVISQQFWIVFGALRNKGILKKLNKEYFGLERNFNKKVMNILIPQAWRSGLGVLVNQGLIQFSGLMYAQVGIPSEVASYLIAMRFITMISQFSQSPFYSKVPSMMRLYASNYISEALELSKKGMLASHFTFVAGGIIVSILAEYSLDKIGSNTKFVNPSVWMVLCFGFFFERIGAMHLQLYSITGKIVWHIANSVAGLLMIAIAIIAYSHLKLLSFPLAILISNVIWYMPYCVIKSSNEFGAKQILNELKSTGWALFLLGFGMLIYYCSADCKYGLK